MARSITQKGRNGLVARATKRRVVSVRPHGQWTRVEYHDRQDINDRPRIRETLIDRPHPCRLRTIIYELAILRWHA